MKVYERLADAFIAEGTKHVFGMMGDGNMYWMNALSIAAWSCIEVRHEGVGLGMADGWARHMQARRCNGDVRPGRDAACDSTASSQRALNHRRRVCGRAARKDHDYHQRLNQSRLPPVRDRLHSAGYARIRRRGGAPRVLSREAQIASDHVERADGYAAEGMGRRRAV